MNSKLNLQHNFEELLTARNRRVAEYRKAEWELKKMEHDVKAAHRALVEAEDLLKAADDFAKVCDGVDGVRVRVENVNVKAIEVVSDQWHRLDRTMFAVVSPFDGQSLFGRGKDQMEAIKIATATMLDMKANNVTPHDIYTAQMEDADESFA